MSLDIVKDNVRDLVDKSTLKDTNYDYLDPINSRSDLVLVFCEVKKEINSRFHENTTKPQKRLISTGGDFVDLFLKFVMVWQDFQILKNRASDYLFFDKLKDEDKDDRIWMRIEIQLFLLYVFGAKCIRLTKSVREKLLNKEDNQFLGEFSKTRDIVFQHTDNPGYKKDIVVKRADLGVLNSSQVMDIFFILNDKESQEFRLDFQDDISRFETIIYGLITKNEFWTEFSR